MFNDGLIGNQTFTAQVTQSLLGIPHRRPVFRPQPMLELHAPYTHLFTATHMVTLPFALTDLIAITRVIFTLLCDALFAVTGICRIFGALSCT